MKITLNLAQKLWSLYNGESLISSQLKGKIIEEMIEDGVLFKKGIKKASIHLVNKGKFDAYLLNHFNIEHFEKYIQVLQKEDPLKSDLTLVSGNSKLKSIRSFKGFLVNSFEPILAQINGCDFVIQPTPGTFQFIYDFERFEVPSDITIVGIENPENFRHIRSQMSLFKNIKPLFISRYPQNQSKDVIRWLQSIGNSYLHFGDFDFAGIQIFLNEYAAHLGTRAQYFIPLQIEVYLNKYGNPQLYDQQTLHTSLKNIQEEKLFSIGSRTS